MILQLAIGSVVVSLTVAVEAIFIGAAIRAFGRFGPWLATPPHASKAVLALIAITLWVLAALTLSVWLWAAAFIIVGEFDTLEPALYFSLSAFTTLGFGDVLLSETWRLLSGMSAANGLLLFGLSTAFLIEFLSRLRHAHESIVRLTGSDL